MQNALQCETLQDSLTTIASEYRAIADLVDIETGVCLTIARVLEIFETIDFGSDSCKIKRYIDERLKK